ncbi:MAG: class I tRNA ligase family protein, partial [Patescibacteria group bacterium]
MALRFYNTLTRSFEEFKPINPPRVGIYSCGPTVYGSSHIGNYRAYIFADILKRTLSYLGYEVKQVMNLTDVDDKTIRDSQKAGKSLRDFTEYFTQEFYKDRDLLNIASADIYTKATDYINEMVSIIETLLAKGYAYKSEDGSVYFSIEKDKEYGKLSHLDLGTLKEGASGRIKAD